MNALRNSGLSAVVSLLVVAILGPRAFAGLPPGYTIMDLGHGKATAINNTGQVAMFPHWDINNLGQYAAFEGNTTIPTGSDSEALAINDLGQVVGWADFYAYQGYRKRAVLWQDYLLADLGVPDQIVWSGISGLPVGGTSMANDINNAVQVVGWFDYPIGTGRYAFVWQQGKYVRLPLASGMAGMEATAINEAGQVVGMSASPDSERAFLWTDTNGDGHADLSEILDLGIEGADVWPSAINSTGQVVGTRTHHDAYPFIWDAGELAYLQNFLPPDTDWELEQALDINDSGEIVGWGWKGNHVHMHAFRMTPIPEPSTLALLAFTAAGVLIRRITS